jgi:hypothetical protein
VETRLVLAARQKPSENDELEYLTQVKQVLIWVDPIIIALLLLFLVGRWRSHNAVALAVGQLQIRDELQAPVFCASRAFRLPGSTRRT